MANSEIKVGLKFSADVSRAKQDIKSLESSMADLMTAIAKTDPMDSLTDGLGEARKQASMLQAALQQSVNVKTGTFDLSKFSKSLKDYGTNLKEVSANLQKLGPEGEAAFNSLTSSIVSAEIPAKRVNKTFAEFTKQLKNVARYQISTKIYNELVGSLEQAWIYAKNLNRSLNDIRIVTGYSVDDMAKFAEKANAAARALSSTTNEYAKASLIYFQQGLSDAEVEQRTATTIKLANVTGQSAQEVSEYMTAVWNNFDDGTKSLEYYADAITKLGAATASSSEEIATGLQKFSAVAQSVGLSYEYATSMLATVTSQTRESAETVGTSFKTILARLESLSLGETLDDETTMTKYSQALAKVGVSIKDQTGALKDMDTIIQEIGETWNKISADQRIALAQTVAGMRQYNNFIALMDNYDTFQMNVQLATESEGSLQEQADIYAESWEAATKRVEAAAEELYDKLINDEFFIDLLDTVEGLIDGFSNLVDSMGGVPGLLSTIGFVLTKVFHNQIGAGITEFTEKLTSSRKEIIEMKDKARELADQQADKALSANDPDYYEKDAENEIRGESLKLQIAMAENEDYLTEGQKARLKILIEQQNAIAQQVRDSAQLQVSAQKELEIKRAQLQEELALKAARLEGSRQNQANLSNLVNKFSNAQIQYSQGSSSTNQFKDELKGILDELREGFDLVSDEGAKAFSEALKQVLGSNAEVLLSGDVQAEDALRKTLTDSAIGGEALIGEIQAAQASQFSRETGLDYATSMNIVKETRGMESPVFSQQYSKQLAINAAADQAVENYRYFGSDEFLSKKSTEAQAIIDRFAKNETSLEEFRQAIDKFSEGDEETKAAISLLTDALEETYTNAKTLEDSLEADANKFLKDRDGPKSAEAQRGWNENMYGDSSLSHEPPKSKEERDKRIQERIRKDALGLDGKIKRLQSKQKAANRMRAVEQAGGGTAAEETIAAIEKELEVTELREASEKRLNQVTQEGVKITKERMSSLTEGFLKSTEGILGIVSALKLLRGTSETLSDPNKNFGEKLTASLMATTTILPMLISSIKALRDAKMADNLETIKSIALQAKNNTVLAAKNVTTWAAAVAEKGLKKATDEATKAKWAENAAWYASPILWIPLVIAAAVAAVVGLIAITKKMTEALSASAKAGKELEKAKEQTKNLENALSEAKTEAEALKNTFDEYNSIQFELAKCVQGTDEWTKALNTNNEKVLELMKLYPQLSTMINEAGEAAISRNIQTGALEITDWAIEDLKEQSVQSVNNLNTAMLGARANERDKNVKLNVANIMDTLNTSGAQLSSYFSNPNTYRNMVGQSISQTKQWYDEKDIIEDNIVELLNLKDDELDNKLEDLGVSSFNIGEWSDQIEKYASEFPDAAQEIVSAMDANTLAAKAETDAIKRQLLSDNQRIQDSRYTEQIIASTATSNAETIDKQIEREKQILENDKFGKKGIAAWSDSTDTEAKKYWKEYAAAAGLDDVEFTDITGTGNDRAFRYKVWNEDSKAYETKSVSLDDMLQVVAAQRVNQSIEDQAGILAELYGRSTQEQVNLMTAVRGDTSFLSRATIAELAAQGEKLDITSLGLTDEQIATFGGAEAFEKVLEDIIGKAQKAWNKNISIMMSSTQESLNTLIENQSDNENFKKLTDAQLTAYGQALDQIYQSSGKESQESFSILMNSLIAENKEQANKIVEIASGIDWTDGDQGLIDLHNQLEENGITINENSAAWIQFSENIQNTPLSLLNYNLDKIKDKIAEIKEIVKDVSFGSIVSDEDYKKIVSYSRQAKDMFIMTAEGYRFIGESSELTAISLANSRKRLKDGIQAATELVPKAVNEFGSYKEFGVLSETSDKNRLYSRAGSLYWDSGITDEMLGAAGFYGGKEGLNELRQKLFSEDAVIAQDAMNELQTLYGNIAKLQQKVANGELISNAYETYASEFKSVAELQEEYWTDIEWTPEAQNAFDTQLEYLQKINQEYEKSIDYYQNEEAELKKLNRQYDKLEKIKENVSGEDYLKALSQEIKLTEQMEKVNQDGRNQANSDRRDARADLNKFFKETLGNNRLGLEIDDKGNVLNWEELDASMINTSEEEKIRYEELKDRILDSQEKYENYSEAIIENKDLQKQLWIESATYAAKYNDTIRDLQLEWLEFQLEAVEDAEFSAALGLSALNDKTKFYTESANDTAASLNNLAAEFNIAPRVESESIVDFIERIKTTAPEASEKISEIMANYKTSLSEMREADKELAASLVTHFEQVAEKFDKVSQQIENLGKTAEHYRNIVDLVGRDNFNNIEETLDGLNKMEENIAVATLKVSRSKAETLAADTKKAEEEINAAVQNGDMGTAETWRKTWEDLKNQQQVVLEEMQSGWESALEAAAAVFEDKTNRILDAFEKSMSGTFGSFDRMSEVFGQQSELNAQYVADYKKVYELSKLTRNIQNQIDNTDSLAAKQSMRELQEEITQLQADGTEMSQYDLEYLQKKYDLRVAEIALEEAQNAKSQVKLQKMSDGSWGYVYTQNADAVANAQQNYEDKLFALQELSTNYLDTTSEQIISTQAEFQEAINTIMTSGLSDEEKRKQIEETVQFYQDRLQFLTSEFDEVIVNNQGMANMVQSFGDSMLGAMYPDKEFDSADNIFSQFKEQVGDWESGTGVMGELKIALTDFQNSTTAIFKEVGYSSMEEFVSALNTFSAGGKLSETMTTLFNEDGTLKEGAIPGIDNIVTSVANSRAILQETYSNMYQDYVDYLNSMSGTKIDIDGNIVAPGLEFTSGAAVIASTEGFDTGGYTGSWGSEGKLAVLHEKELVLNKQDTENLLHTMEVMDKLIKSIDIGAAAARFNHQLTSVSTSSNKETLRQEVVIHAEFPNATNHSEIEEAFDSLINRAAQYANRNR